MTVIVAVLACGAGLLEPGGLAVAVAVAVLVAVLGGLALDVFGGAVVGLVAAAGLIALKRFLGDWGPDGFWVALVETVAIMAAGATAGIAGSALRPRRAEESTPTGALLDPVFGSLGLLDHDAAVLRLEEEVDRALRHRRPLTLALVETEVVDASLGADAREAALRAVARLLEQRLPDADVVFATSRDHLGAILPETDATRAWERLGRFLDGVQEGSFQAREEGGPRRLADAVEVHLGLAELGADRRSADALIDAATAGLRQAQGAGVPPGGPT